MRSLTMMMGFAWLFAGSAGHADTRLPTGQLLTPLAVPGARFSPLMARTVQCPDAPE